MFEVFELAPAGKLVAQTKGRILRSFPDAAVTLTQETIEGLGFRECFSPMIEDMSRNSAPNMPKSIGSGEDDRFRDTADPFIVTELLFTILRVHGTVSQTEGIWKHIRDENLWLEGKDSPWRRSPTWLLLKIALQLSFTRKTANGKGGRSFYKKAMIHFLAKLLQEAIDSGISSEYIHAMTAKIVRRLVKLDTQLEGWMSDVSETLSSASLTLKTRWEDFVTRDQENLQSVQIQMPDVLRDIQIPNPGLDHCLQSLQHKGKKPTNDDFQPPSILLRFLPQTLPQLSSSTACIGKYELFGLAAFENWVIAELGAGLSPMKTSERLAQIFWT